MVQLRARGTRRRAVARSSDDEEDSYTSNANSDTEGKGLNGSSVQQLPFALRTRKAPSATPKSRSNNTSTSSTPRSTPKKPKAPIPKSKSPDQSSTRTLYSFFNVATQRQQQSAAASNTPNSVPLKQEDDGDSIHDAISDGDDGLGSSGIHADNKTNHVRPKKRLHDGLDPHGLISGSQKYIKRADGSREATTTTLADRDPRPWNEKYGPTELAELVVHKKKVADVRNWLENSLSGHKYSKLLVLKGAAGSGKTATLSMLALALKFEIIEWRNPTLSDNQGPNTVSASAQFDDFVGRGSRFGGLDLVSASSLEDEPSLAQVTKPSSCDKQVLVVEEFPNNLTRATAALNAFRSSVVQFLERSSQQATPLVMVISEMVDSSSSLDNFTAHRLLGPEILHHPCVAVIEFNRVAPTFITKALNMTLQKHRRETRSPYEPSNGALKKLSEFGDVRNAISTLEFLCTQRDVAQAAVRSVKSEPKSRSAKGNAALRPDSDDISSAELSIISLRESSIGLFHALGKVLYNKRIPLETTPLSSSTPSSILMPDHLSIFSRPLVSEVDLDSLIDETGTDTSTFLSALHENYLLSCFSPDGNSETTMEHIIGCLAALTDADLLLRDYSIYESNVSGSSGLRQSELSFHTAVCGLLFNLPYPVKRQAPPSKGKADAHRMFYPTSLKLWRNKEEMQGLIEMFTQKALNGTLLPPLMRSKTLSAGNFSRHSGQTPFKLAKQESRTNDKQSDAHETVATDDSTPGRVIVGSGHSARYEMLLERLPYMKLIYSPNTTPAGPSLLKQINQVTQFSGVGNLPDDDEDESLEGHDNLSATGTSVFLGKNAKEVKAKAQSIFSSSAAGKTAVSLDGLVAVEKLVLSDDDIEDD